MFRNTCILALTLAVCFASVELGLLAQQLRYHTVPLVNQELKIVGGSSTNIEKGLRQWELQSGQEASSVRDASQSLNRDLLTFGVLLSTANSTLVQQQNSLTGLETQTQSLLTGGSELVMRSLPVMDGLQQTVSNSASASKQVSDSLSRSLPHLESIATSIDSTSHDTQVFTQNMDTESDLLVGATKKALAPKNKALSILESTGGGAVTVLELAYYLTHGG